MLKGQERLLAYGSNIECLCLFLTFTDGGSNPRCADALYCMPMPRTSSESSTKVHLQRTLKGGDSVVEVRTLTRCGTSEQSLVLLEAMKSPASDG